MVLTAQHIGQNGAFEPQRSNAFTFEVDVPYSGGRTLISLALNSAFIPKFETEVFTIDYMNEQVQFAGKPKTAQSGNIKLIDYVDQNVRNALLSWYYQVYNPTNGAVGLAGNYKRDAYIVTFGPEGSYTRMYKLVGAFPSVIEGSELNYSDAKQVEITVTIAYDKVIPLKGNQAVEDIQGVGIGTKGFSFTGVNV